MSITEPRLRKVDGYVVDCITEENPRATTEITAHPVESGATLSDHARNLPIRIDLVAVVSDTPIGEVAKERTPGVIHTSEARAFFRRLRRELRPFTFEGVTGTYTNMMIEELGEPMGPETGASIVIELTLVEVDIREVRRLTVREPRLGHRASRDVDIGQPLWLCPDLVVSNRYANNVGKQCRRVIVKPPNKYVFADTGQELNTYEFIQLREQRQEVERLQTGGDAYFTRTEGRYSKVFERIDPRTGKIRSVGMGIQPGSPQAQALERGFAAQDTSINRYRDTVDRARQQLTMPTRPPDDDIAGTTGKWY